MKKAVKSDAFLVEKNEHNLKSTSRGTLVGTLSVHHVSCEVKFKHFPFWSG